MPKIIENVREQLLAEAKRQIMGKGYSQTTIRSVASACGFGVGTVYNYFPSKDMLIAAFMLQDWQACLKDVKDCSGPDDKCVLKGIYDALRGFSDQYHALFSDSDATKVFATAFAEKHKLLRNQLAEIILPICKRSKAEDKAFLAEFIAEALLSWTIEGKSFHPLSDTITLLLK